MSKKIVAIGGEEKEPIKIDEYVIVGLKQRIY